MKAKERGDGREYQGPGGTGSLPWPPDLGNHWRKIEVPKPRRLDLKAVLNCSGGFGAAGAGRRAWRGS